MFSRLLVMAAIQDAESQRNIARSLASISAEKPELLEKLVEPCVQVGI